VKNDLISVGPPQYIGDRIDRPLGLDPELKTGFEKVLEKNLEKNLEKKRDLDPRRETALGGTNRKVPIDRNDPQKKEALTDARETAEIERKEKERRKTKTSESGVEMPISNPMVSIESSLEVGSLESDFSAETPELDLKNKVQAGESQLSDQMAFGQASPELASSAETLEPSGEIDMEAPPTTMPIVESESSDLNAEPAGPSDFETSIHAQLSRDQKDLVSEPNLEGQLKTTANPSSEMDLTSLQSNSEKPEDALQPEIKPESKAAPEMSLDARIEAMLAEQADVSTNQEQPFSGDLSSREDQSQQDSSSGTESTPSTIDQSQDLTDSSSPRESDFRSFASGTTSTNSAANGTQRSQESSGISTTDRAEIVKQAQVLVDEGGGSAKIQLESEELGSIDLRVRLVHGKVQIEVGSNDPAIKAAIEDSLSDLKSSLAQHNFELDHVKIKSVAGMSDSAAMQSNTSNSGNGSAGMQNQSESNGFRNMFSPNGGNEFGRNSSDQSRSGHEVQLRDLGVKVSANAARSSESKSETSIPMMSSRGIGRYQKGESLQASAATRSQWVA